MCPCNFGWSGVVDGGVWLLGCDGSQAQGRGDKYCDTKGDNDEDDGAWDGGVEYNGEEYSGAKFGGAGNERVG